MKLIVCIENALDVTQSFQISETAHEIVNYTKILNPWDEFAIEAALLQKDKTDCEIIVLTIGLEESQESLRKAFAMGCDSMIRIDIDPTYLDQKQVSIILKKAILKIGEVDLVLLGKKSIDYETGTIPIMLAHQLNLPFIADISSIESIDSQGLSATYQIDQERIKAEIQFPAVISINKDFAEPRFPSFLGIRKAAKTQIQVFSKQELSIKLSDRSENGYLLTEIPQRRIQTEMIHAENMEEIISTLEKKNIW